MSVFSGMRISASGLSAERLYFLKTMIINLEC